MTLTTTSDTSATNTNDDRPLVGVGSCLVGESVRFNGDHKRRNPHIEALGQHFNFVSICPEVGIGMGVPRKPIRLVQSDQALRAMDSDTQTQDYTDALYDFADQQARLYNFCGYILVKGSPSCGYEKVKRYNAKGNLLGSDAKGLFVQRLATLDPLLPMEDDGRLFDTGLRESFVLRVSLYHHWKQLCTEELTKNKLVGFYSRYKYQIMAHHIPSYKALGSLLANAKSRSLESLREEVIQLMMNALRHVATRGSHTNALQHVQGYLKTVLNSSERQELSNAINQFHQGIVPLIVPITLLKHHFASFPDPYIQQQVFMAPYPEELALRSHLQ